MNFSHWASRLKPSRSQDVARMAKFFFWQQVNIFFSYMGQKIKNFCSGLSYV